MGERNLRVVPYVMRSNLTRDVERGVRHAVAGMLYGAGDLTFAITVLVDEFLYEHDASFEHFAQAIAALEAAKLELYRREIANYEDQKRQANGEVYHDWREYGGEG